MIQISSASKTFGTRPALSDLNLHVSRGEIFGLLGHNGAGKSTAIGLMLGQVWPDAGEIRVCGHDISRERGKALSRVGAIFESPAFYDYLSGWTNLEVLVSYSGPVDPARMREVIEWVGLTGHEKRKVRTYSHGMRARLALAQALLPKPELLILDEPSDGLDPEGIHEMRETILRLRSDLGLTILLSSHLLSEVEQLCDRIAVLNQGRKVFEGGLGSIQPDAEWLRIEVGDLPKAMTDLAVAALADPTGEEGRIQLRKGITPAQVVRFLVEERHEVSEVAREKQTLEGFYMRLMKDSSAKEAK